MDTILDQKPKSAVEAARSDYQKLMDYRAKAMLAGYARGLYPVPMSKRAWAVELAKGLVAGGEVPADHKGEIQIRLVFRGDSRAPEVKLGGFMPFDN